jgi:hypothetical protein
MDLLFLTPQLRLIGEGRWRTMKDDDWLVVANKQKTPGPGKTHTRVEAHKIPLQE